MNPLLLSLLGAATRALLTTGGGAAIMTGDQVTQVTGAASVVVGVLWSAWQKYQASRSPA